MNTEPYVPGLSPEMIATSDAAKAEALRRTLKAGLIGLGGSAALTAVLGLPRALSKKKVPSYPLQTEVDLAYPQEVKKTASVVAETVLGNPLASSALEAYLASRTAENKLEGAVHGGAKGLMAGAASVPAGLISRNAGRYLMKALRSNGMYKMPIGRLRRSMAVIPKITAALGGSTAYVAARPYADRIADKMFGEPKQADWADGVVKHTMSPAAGSPSPAIGTPSWVRGDNQTTPNAIPWAFPAIAGAAVGGIAGGHSLVRHILRKRRKNELEKALQQAQKEYDESMLSQYDPDKLRQLSAPKEASAGTAIDRCFDILEKTGFDLNALLGNAAGLYGVGAGALGTASAVGTYRWLRSRSNDKLLREALKRRAMQRSLQNPPDMYVRPVPVEYVEK